MFLAEPNLVGDPNEVHLYAVCCKRATWWQLDCSWTWGDIPSLGHGALPLLFSPTATAPRRAPKDVVMDVRATYSEDAPYI